MKTQQEALQEVLDICKDGAKGYERAASDVSDSELRTIFNRLAQQRKLFIEELKSDGRDLGLSLDESASTEGFFHRKWIDIKSKFSSHEIKDIIEESKFGEEAAVKTYSDALQSDLPAYIKDRLENQRHLIAGCITQLNEFESSFAE